ncbi:Ig-like domain-containing protein [Gammaproteobacteria bacterium]|nr:Ig-like domain-containing protein [Gammaproteobacteria bacterium]
MLDSSFLKILFFTLVLSSCGGGNSSVTPLSEGSFVTQPKSINGLVVDGYIRNADVWIETTNDFSNIGEIKTSSSVQGKFGLTTSLNDYRVQSSGGIDLDTNNSLDGLVLINHKIDELASADTAQNFIISPLTTADFFLSESLNKLTNPISITINDLLGLDQNFNVNTVDHVASLNDGFMYAEAYERANQLTSLSLSLTRLVNNLSTSDIISSDIFRVILDRMVAIYQSSQNEVNIESTSFIDALVDDVNLKFSLSLESEIKTKVKNMYKAFIPLIQVKPNLAASHGLFYFATNTFFNDIVLVASNNDQENIYSKYSLDLITYISEISGQTESNLAFSITSNSDSVSSFEDQTFNINVLENDDYDNQSSYNISFTQPNNGTVSKDNLNILVYQPNANFNGNDSFSYTLEQGSLSSTASVSILVQPLPDAPIISISSTEITIPENQINVVDIVASDVDGDPLSYSLSGTDSAYFSISSSGELSFINPPDYETKSSFEVTVSVSDGALSDSKNLVINISNVVYEVDLLVYYAPDMLSKWTTENGVETRVLYLIESANNALKRSQSEVQFNLLKLLPYDVDVSNQSGNTIFSSLLGREKIKKDQIMYGADYFILVSSWDSAKGQTGGTASIDLTIDNLTDWDAAHGYLSAWSVDPNWSEPGCNPCFPDKVFAHELGHNLGSGHWPGETGQSYAYGHRVDGNTDGDFTDSFDWGTVMSYNDISPDYFSNPNVSCKNGLACGVVNVSDNTKWYNNLGTRFSSILPASSLDNSNTSNKINIKNYFPKISGGISTFSNAGSSRIFQVTEFSDVDINGQIYKSFKWENTSNGNPKMAYHFYEKDNKYFINRTDYEAGYKFSNQDEYTLYNNNNLCVFFDSFQSIGNYLARDCSNAHYGDPPVYNDVFHFNHFIKSENISVPYGSFSTIKYVFTLWDNNNSPYSDTPYLMHTVFWLNSEMGIIQYRDHLGRIWKLESTDSDGDGIDNKLDNDDDNDGVLDSSDAFKLDPTASVDSNSDGIPD